MPFTLLGIETSCDETAAAVVRDGVIQHVSAHQAVIHDVGALRRRAVDKRGGQRR